MIGMEIILEVEESPEDGLQAHALGPAISNEAETLEKHREMVRDAVRCQFDAETAPRPNRLHLVKDEGIPA
jgi:hypothetical protein